MLPPHLFSPTSRTPAPNSFRSGTQVTRLFAIKEFMHASILLFASLLAGVFLAQQAFTAESPSRPRKKSLSDELFHGPIRQIQIEIDAPALEMLRQDPRTYVKGTVKEGNLLYREVAIRLKGSAGSFRPVDHNPAFTLNFDKFVASQRFHGLDKLHLNNSVQDPTFMHEILGSESFLAAGIPTPKAVPVLVQLNGRNLGLYILKGGFDKVFLKEHFSNTKGNLYDPQMHQDVDSKLEKDSGSNPKDRSDLDALVAAASEPDRAKRFAKLSTVLDAQLFARFIALEVLTFHWDGYAMGRNNYRIYNDPSRDRLVFLPHGMDQLFGNPEGSLFPPMGGMIARALIQTSEGRQLYIEQLRQLHSSALNVPHLIQRIDQLSSHIQPALAEYNPQLANDHARLAADLKARITRRSASVDRQLQMLLEQP
jgi:spore coat protein H